MKRLRLALPSILGIVLFLVALLVLRHELRGHTTQEMIHALRNIPTARILFAVLLSTTAYLILTAYDALAFYFIKHRLPYRKIALTSFIGYALGNNVGISAIACGSVRYRFYSAHGLSALQVLQIAAFASLTFWVGFSAVASIVFLAAPPLLPPSLHLPFGSVQPFGFLLLVLLLTYLVANLFSQQRTLTLFRQTFFLPTFRVSIGQVAISSLEWLFTASIPYVLLPHVPGFSYPQFLGIFLVAHIAGVSSQVPGGFGVFESVILGLLPSFLPLPDAFAALLVFRLVYNLLPLTAATVIMGGREVMQRRRKWIGRAHFKLQ
jgi:uncharacterized membrane protein YbhN (UPF0104 family)